MDTFKLLWKLLKFRFTAPFTRDQHFNRALRSFFVLGFYQKSSKTKSISSILTVVLVFGSMYSGCILRLYRTLKTDNSRKLLAAATPLLRFTIVMSELLSFHAKKMKIKRMIRNFHEMKDKRGSKYKKLCGRIITSITIMFCFSITLHSFLNVFVNEKVHFYLPVIYEQQGIYDWSSLIYLVYVLHCILFASGVVSIELLPIVSVLKLEGLVASLCCRMEEMTSGDLGENERKLDECIKFHVKVLK
jgi:hypothetical protein